MTNPGLLYSEVSVSLQLIIHKKNIFFFRFQKLDVLSTSFAHIFVKLAKQVLFVSWQTWKWNSMALDWHHLFAPSDSFIAWPYDFIEYTNKRGLKAPYSGTDTQTPTENISPPLYLSSKIEGWSKNNIPIGAVGSHLGYPHAAHSVIQNLFMILTSLPQKPYLNTTYHLPTACTRLTSSYFQGSNKPRSSIENRAGIS